MLPPKKKSPTAQRELERVFAGLNDLNRESVLAFAQFLLERQGPAESSLPEVPQQPLEIPRPDEESVVGAIRRLANTYPMLNKDELLHASSSLMSGHIMHGRPASEVIDELETLFAEAYDRYAPDEST
jgi:hypothetical protein